jgi:catechol 2,3-dioxygenase-like lactoylglutathione lyase family enzyme
MTTDIVAPNGIPVSICVIGSANLERSLEFYRDLHGMEAGKPVRWSGGAFEAHWHLPKGSSATAVLLHAGPDPVGRVLLLEFDAKDRKEIRGQARFGRSYGLFNINFYTADIWADYRRFKAKGYEFWSEPVQHAFTGNVGSPIEVVFEGPDSVLVNWVELAATDPQQRIGKMKAYVEQYGRTRTGFTPVVTTASVMRDIAVSRRFYEQVFDMGIHINQVLESEGYRKFQRVPPGGRTQVTFMQGNHMFGKIATSQPLNYDIPDVVPLAVAPNIGYIAQSFLVPDLTEYERRCRVVGAEVYTPRMDIEIPGLGMRHAMIVRNPGSGCLQQLIER